MNEQPETGCCPRFNPEPWEEKEISFQNKLFLKDRIRCFFHIPLNMNQVMLRNMQLILSSGAVPPEPLMLYDAKSSWKADVYIAVGKEIAGAEMARVSGDFLTKVFEGPYKNCGRWAEEMKKYVISKGRQLEKLYFFYTTCPKCAKFYGKNYIVMLAKV